MMETTSRTHVASQMAPQSETSAASTTSHTSVQATTTHTHKDVVSDSPSRTPYKAHSNTTRHTSGRRLETLSTAHTPAKASPSEHITPTSRSNANAKTTKTEIPNKPTNANSDTAARPTATDVLVVTNQPVMATKPSTTIEKAQTKVVPPLHTIMNTSKRSERSLQRNPKQPNHQYESHACRCKIHYPR